MPWCSPSTTTATTCPAPSAATRRAGSTKRWRTWWRTDTATGQDPPAAAGQSAAVRAALAGDTVGRRQAPGDRGGDGDGVLLAALARRRAFARHRHGGRRRPVAGEPGALAAAAGPPDAA